MCQQRPGTWRMKGSTGGWQDPQREAVPPRIPSLWLWPWPHPSCLIAHWYCREYQYRGRCLGGRSCGSPLPLPSLASLTSPCFLTQTLPPYSPGSSQGPWSPPGLPSPLSPASLSLQPCAARGNFCNDRGVLSLCYRSLPSCGYWALGMGLYNQPEELSF